MKKLIVANWKSQKNIQEAKKWLDMYGKQVTSNSEAVEVTIAPPFNLLNTVKAEIEQQSLPLSLAVQDLSAYPAGKYTGAISTHNLQEMSIAYAIIGHSERRRYFHETSLDVVNKVEQALNAGITPLVCIDEPYLDEQISALDTETFKSLTVVYEPLAAIGSGNNVSVKKVSEIKDRVQQLCGEVRFLYGGSVSESSIAEYFLVSDGVIVGSASVDPEEFSRVVLQVS